MHDDALLDFENFLVLVLLASALFWERCFGVCVYRGACAMREIMTGENCLASSPGSLIIIHHERNSENGTMRIVIALASDQGRRAATNASTRNSFGLVTEYSSHRLTTLR